MCLKRYAIYLIAFLYSFQIQFAGEDVEKNDFILTPGRYVGIAPEEEDSEPFEEKMDRLTKELSDQFKRSDELEEEIKKNLEGLGWKI